MELEDIIGSRKTKIEKKEQPGCIFNGSFSGCLKHLTVGFDGHTDYSLLKIDYALRERAGLRGLADVYDLCS